MAMIFSPMFQISMDNETPFYRKESQAHSSLWTLHPNKNQSILQGGVVQKVTGVQSQITWAKELVFISHESTGQL